ncbi:MAG: hypothetical protein BGN85_13640 [Alphaproteobacteria bacterium 64-11]|nr:MAG: hypothetical protein BGN85_13640 [Alphaproteobacteria bacterium 64-11]
MEGAPDRVGEIASTDPGAFVVPAVTIDGVGFDPLAVRLEALVDTGRGALGLPVRTWHLPAADQSDGVLIPSFQGRAKSFCGA